MFSFYENMKPTDSSSQFWTFDGTVVVVPAQKESGVKIVMIKAADAQGNVTIQPAGVFYYDNQ